MARPLKEGMDYFPHDTDASNDEKIEALRALHGNDGYAFYFILLERIYKTSDAEMDISKPAIKASLINKIGVTPEKFEQILDTAFDIDCLDRETYEKRQVLTSRGIQKRFKEVEELRAKWRDKRKPKENPIDNPGDNLGDNPEQTPQRKEKESKEKKSINYSLEIEKFRSRYSPEQMETIEQYLGILRTTRVSGKLSPSVEHGVYEDMHRYDPLIVEHACKTVIAKPDLHAKKENYFAGILRNTTVDEALKGLLPSRASPQQRVNGAMFGADAEVV